MTAVRHHPAHCHPRRGAASVHRDRPSRAGRVLLVGHLVRDCARHHGQPPCPVHHAPRNRYPRASAAGPGRQALTWQPRNGAWTVVAMNADGSRPVSVRIAVAATLPALPWVAAGLLIAGLLVLVVGVTLIIISARRASAQIGAPPPQLNESV